MLYQVFIDANGGNNQDSAKGLWFFIVVGFSSMLLGLDFSTMLKSMSDFSDVEISNPENLQLIFLIGLWLVTHRFYLNNKLTHAECTLHALSYFLKSKLGRLFTHHFIFAKHAIPEVSKVQRSDTDSLFFKVVGYDGSEDGETTQSLHFMVDDYNAIQVQMFADTTNLSLESIRAYRYRRYWGIQDARRDDHPSFRSYVDNVKSTFLKTILTIGVGVSLPAVIFKNISCLSFYLPLLLSISLMYINIFKILL